MAFSLPDFNITCNIYSGPYLARTIRPASPVPCNLAFSRRQQFPTADEDANGWSVVMSLLLPPLTDIRDLSCSAVQDVVECPAGSGRWYQVGMVDDIGKGFPNEHRCALIYKISEAMWGASYLGLSWPGPIP